MRFPWSRGTRPDEPGSRPDARAALSLTGVSVAYGERRALHPVDLTVAPRSLTAIVGPSGCGKSSLLVALNRLSDAIPGCRVTGRAQLGDLDLLHPTTDPVLVRRRIGLVFQRPHPFPMSIRRNLTLAWEGRARLDRQRRSALVEASLRAVGLWDEVKDRLDKPGTSLSGGQQQRLCLARALALEPEVLLLDEPCSSLDPHSAAVVEEHLSALRGRVTMLLVTHDLRSARRLSDRIAVFGGDAAGGQLWEVGPTEQMFSEARDPRARAYLAGR